MKTTPAILNEYLGIQIITLLFVGLLFLAFILLGAAAFNIDYIPWISYLSPEISVICDGQKIIYDIDPNLVINGTTNKLLDPIQSFLYSVGWKRKFNLGEIDIVSYFNNTGNDYGGVWLNGPSISIAFNQKKQSPNCSKSYEVEIIDIRDICADTLKNGVCAKKPLEWARELFQ